MATKTAAPVTPEAKPVKASRPKTCGQFFAANGVGEAGCKRLPRHSGDHRVTLHRPAPTKSVKAAAKPSKRTAAPKGPKNAAERKAFLADLASQVEAGTMAPSDALSAASKMLSAASKRRVSRKPKAT